MLDSHLIPSVDWGIRPILFSMNGFNIPSYSFFVALGVIIGFGYYVYQAKKDRRLGENSFVIVIAALLGGAIGAKVFKFVIDYQFVISHFSDSYLLLSGRTIVGGFIGGYVAVAIVKRVLKIRERKGNYFAPGIALGVAVGRIGCFLAGCCYGKATGLPIGIDFGDGVLRHPTQLYESVFMIVMFFYLSKIRKKESLEPGYLFKVLMVGYFIFRFFVEFLKEETVILMGLNIFQLISVCAIIYLLRDDIFKRYRK
ncbi:MAG: prolipoprotein diacylglyceryl transferase [Candidatus Pacebacteria bacterium]|nr:prolipoprotein diacylglyceryl transferase [Candidatus Paceibacterota bacterium]